jgi:cardiolipin synthase
MMSGAAVDLVGAVVAVGGFVIHRSAGLRAITRPNRTPASRVAWIAAIMCLPDTGW